MQNVLKTDQSRKRQSRFIETSEQFVNMAMVDGFNLIPYVDPELPYFLALPDKEQDLILQQLEFMIQIGNQLHSEKRSVRGSQYAWAFCKALGLLPPHDLYARIPEDTVIEIYDANHKLIFACLDFFEIVSYSLEELYSRPWMDLFVRDNTEVFDKLWNLSTEMLAGQHKGPVTTSHFDSSVIREAAYPNLRWARIQPRLFAPLFKHQKVSGYICANEIVEMSLNCIPAKQWIALQRN